MRILHLFDIDGTLVHVAEEEAFAQAFLEHHGPEIDLSFDVKAPITDMGYVGSVLERHFGRSPADGEVRALLDRFVDILGARTESGELPVRAVAGASTFVPALAARAPVAVSTGCVEGSARLKLAKVGLEDVFPCGAFSIGERSRADIVRRAIASAASGYGSRFEAVVLFGDGPWDLVSAVEAGISFVGINEGERGRERLRDAGARWVFADYADAEVIEQAVRRACAT